MAGQTPGLSPSWDPSWHRIGRICGANRRSLWIRETYVGEESIIELAAGREGDDAYVKITKANPQYRDLVDVLTSARFAAEWEQPEGFTLEEEEALKRKELRFFWMSQDQYDVMRWTDDGGRA